MATWKDLFATHSIDEDLISLTHEELLEIKNKTESLLKIKEKEKRHQEAVHTLKKCAQPIHDMSNAN